MASFHGRGSLSIGWRTVTGTFTLFHRDDDPTGWGGTFTPDTFNTVSREYAGQVATVTLERHRHTVRAFVRRVDRWGAVVLDSPEQSPF